ncbi:hypothetical protein ACUR5C_15185 [Aliikangiella sp. IMCC44653]
MTKSNKKWDKQAQAAKATQVAFDVSEVVHNHIQFKSVEDQLKPSDYIRKLLGLSFKRKKVRPRLTVTLTEEDYLELAKKYNLPSDDKIAIKHAVTKTLISAAEK